MGNCLLSIQSYDPDNDVDISIARTVSYDASVPRERTPEQP